MDTKEYELKITPAAAEDLENIYKYIKDALLSKSVAENMVIEINEKIRSLKHFPYKCELSRDISLRLRGYRRLIIKNYVVLYLINEKKNQVIIARIFYGPMDYAAHI